MLPGIDPSVITFAAEQVVSAITVAGIVAFLGGVVMGVGWTFVETFAERMADNHYRSKRARQQAIPGLDVYED